MPREQVQAFMILNIMWIGAALVFACMSINAGWNTTPLRTFKRLRIQVSACFRRIETCDMNEVASDMSEDEAPNNIPVSVS